MGAKASKAEEEKEKVFFEQDDAATDNATDQDGQDGQGQEDQDKDGEGVETAKPRTPSPPPPPSTAEPLPDSENKFAQRFKERKGSFKKFSEGDKGVSNKVVNSNGSTLPTKETPNIKKLSINSADVKNKFNNTDFASYPKIQAQINSGALSQEEAATKIQAAFRGSQARKEQTEKEEAATKIQAAFRGSQARKQGQRHMARVGDTDFSELYAGIVEPVMDKIETLYSSIDTHDWSGETTGLGNMELKTMIYRYNGTSEFDETKFNAWWGEHVASPDVCTSEELGKYLAEVAISGDLPIGPVIDKFANIDDAMALQGKYNAVLAADGIQSRVDALFVKLDLDGSGGLDKSELEGLISSYNEKDFEVEQFFAWFDLHGALGVGPEGSMDVKEFGWYLADVALGFESDMSRVSLLPVIDSIERIVTQLQN